MESLGRRIVIFDTETDGLELEDITKMHVVGYRFWGEDEVKTITDPDRMKKFFRQDFIFVGHNIIGYDLPVIQHLFGVDIPIKNVIDTLGLSWYLYSDRTQHGIEAWGNDLGIKKPEVLDWRDGSEELYRHRVEEDVKINYDVFCQMVDILKEIYDNREDYLRLVTYLNFKMSCLRMHQQNKIRIDVEYCQDKLLFLEDLIEEKEDILKKHMPRVPVKALVKKPPKIYKKDGSLSARGEYWFNLLDDLDIPQDYEGSVEFVKSFDDPNPSSPQQVKDWLFSLGWKPSIYKDGANGKVPQIRDDKTKSLCESVMKLAEQYPEVHNLDELSVLNHRAGGLKSFLKNVDENGYVRFGAGGFTRTLRLKHRAPFANMPKITAKYGDIIRGAIIAPEGMVIIGSDVSSLEDRMRQINIYKYDPEFVKEQVEPGYDGHLSLGVASNIISLEDSVFYKWYKKGGYDIRGCPPSYIGRHHEKEFSRLDAEREVLKTSNYALVYGAGVPKLSETIKKSRRIASIIHEGYWKKNWSVLKFAEDLHVKEAGGKSWVFNPVSKLYYHLKNDKDRFAACNSSAGVRVFDGWIYNMVDKGLVIPFQYHDEIFLYAYPENVDKIKNIMRNSMKEVNRMFRFPLDIEIDVKVGERYSEVH